MLVKEQGVTADHKSCRAIMEQEEAATAQGLSLVNSENTHISLVPPTEV